MSELELREHLADFLAAKSSRDEFEDWFVQHSWNIHQSSDISAQKLAYAIELRLAENEEGNLSDEQFREELTALLKRPFIIISNISSGAEIDRLVQTSASISLTSPQWELRSVDMRPEAASSSRAHR